MSIDVIDRVNDVAVDEVSLRIVRAQLPAWVGEPHRNYHRDERGTTCERHEWGYWLPGMFRVLADPTGGLPMPAKPEPEDTLAQLGYWTCLAHLLVWVFGWRDLAKGLWWLQSDQLPASIPVRLLREVWHADGAIPQFYEWSHTVAAALTPQQPLETRQDPFMLAAHVSGPLALTPAPTNWCGDVLVLDSFAGWYTALDRGGRTGRVDVFVRPVGWLGSYRRSPSTGIWTRVDEQSHLAGN